MENQGKIKLKEEFFVEDWVLIGLVNSVNLSEDRQITPITILSHGFLVSGDLIGGKEYFELLSKNFDVNTQNSLQKKVEAIYNDEYLGSNTPKFIHLKNARAFNGIGSGMPSNGFMLFRLKLSEISGFCLGKLDTERFEKSDVS